MSFFFFPLTLVLSFSATTSLLQLMHGLDLGLSLGQMPYDFIRLISIFTWRSHQTVHQPNKSELLVSTLLLISPKAFLDITAFFYSIYNYIEGLVGIVTIAFMAIISFSVSLTCV